MTYQTSRMPEQIRLKVGGPTSGQFSVYDEFGRNIPGFQPLSERDSSLVIPKVTLLVSILGNVIIYLKSTHIILSLAMILGNNSSFTVQ